jgi:cytochrome c-type biogenesis protein CcmH/NrfF
MKIQNLRSVEKICASLLMIIVLFVLVNITIAQEPAAEMGSEKARDYESDLEELITTVYCYCGCTRETIQACVCPTAQNVEIDFRNRLSENETVEEIRTSYLETYGSEFYAVMPAKGINLLAYLMPGVILIVIGGVAFAVLHRSRSDKMDLTQPDKQISDELQQKVESELERYKKLN